MEVSLIANGKSLPDEEHHSFILELKPKKPDKGFVAGTTFDIFVLMHEAAVISQQDARNVFPGWREGDFTTSFPDLYLAAQGLDSFELEDVEKYLSTDIKIADFEAFGMKVPAELVTTCGIVMIICIQLYLYIYLRSLKRPIQMSDKEIWEIGWIAMHKWWLPACMFFVTVFALPLTAVALLSKHALDPYIQQAGLTWEEMFFHVSKTLWFFGNFKIGLLYTLGCLLSFCLGWQVLINRPRLDIEAAES